MTLSATDRNAFKRAIARLDNMIKVLKQRSRPGHPDVERAECLRRIGILAPEIQTLRERLAHLEAAAVVVTPPTPADVEGMNAALTALGKDVAADQEWDAFVAIADTVLTTAQGLADNIGARET